MPVWLSYPPRGCGPSDADRHPVAAAAVPPPPPPPTAATKHCLVFFIPGNPGLVDYYAPFLETLRARLDAVEDAARAHTGRDVRFHVRGRNLLGFDDGDDGGGAYGTAPFDLDTQVRAATDAALAARVDLGRAAAAARRPRHGDVFDEVVLIGHSVGSYIALDVFRRCQDAAAAAAAAAADGTAKSPLYAVHGPVAHLRLRLGVLLFATLTHLAQSPRGRHLERLVELPLLGPYAPLALQALAWGLAWALPRWLLALILARLLAFPPHAAAATLRFLTSRGAVRQALFLGRDELARIGEDQWEDELFEVADTADAADAADRPPKFIILFGDNDHWVADDFRNRFIARRAAHAHGRTRIVMDERGWPHAFCIHHSEEVAETVSTWIADLADEL